MQIALGDDPKRADRCQRAALGAVDSYTVALPNRSALASTWEVEILREHVTRVAFLIPIATALALPRPPRSRSQALQRSRSSSRGSYLSHMVPLAADLWTRSGPTASQTHCEYEQMSSETAIRIRV